MHDEKPSLCSVFLYLEIKHSLFQSKPNFSLIDLYRIEYDGKVQRYSDYWYFIMKKWLKFIPLILLVGYFITYDVVTQVESTHPSAQTSQQ